MILWAEIDWLIQRESDCMSASSEKNRNQLKERKKLKLGIVSIEYFEIAFFSFKILHDKA